MVKLLKSAILLTVFAGFFQALQAQDSLRVYPVVKWRLDRLIDVYAYDYPKCGETVVKLDSALQGLKIALNAGQELIDIRTQERDLKVSEAQGLRDIISKDQTITKQEVKQARKKGRKEGAIIGGGAGLLLLVLLL